MHTAALIVISIPNLSLKTATDGSTLVCTQQQLSDFRLEFSKIMNRNAVPVFKNRTGTPFRCVPVQFVYSNPAHSLEAKTLAYVSLVRLHLEYASAAAAWDPFTARDIKGLEMVQRRAARFVKRNYRSTTSVTTLIGELGWNTLEHRRQTSRLTAMYKAVIDLPNRTETGSGFSGLARSVCRIRIQFHET